MDVFDNLGLAEETVFLAFYQSKRETGKLKGHPHDLHPCTTEVLVEAMIPSEGGRLHDQRSHGGLQWKVAVL